MDRYFTGQRNGVHYVIDGSNGAVVSGGDTKEGAAKECALWNRAEAALLNEVAEWMEKRAENIPGKCATTDCQICQSEAMAIRALAAMLRSDTWRAAQTRRAGGQ